MHSRKGQSVLWIFIIVVVLVFFTIVGWYISTRAFIPVNDAVEPMIASEHAGPLSSVARLQRFWPLGILVGLIVLVGLYMTRTDPQEVNYYR
jgi:heme/copper-type cytochrome/quinol oxidase subunit 3